MTYERPNLDGRTPDYCQGFMAAEAALVAAHEARSEGIKRHEDVLMLEDRVRALERGEDAP